jgi:hypothetical protein
VNDESSYCWKCGIRWSVKTVATNSSVPYPGLEKIEPIGNKTVYGPDFTKSEEEIAVKLNEVIERLNTVMEVMNKKGE